MKNLLKEKRKALNLTQKQVAEVLDITESSVSLHESGGRIPNVKILKKYAKLFNCKVDDLINDPTQN